MTFPSYMTYLKEMVQNISHLLFYSITFADYKGWVLFGFSQRLETELVIGLADLPFKLSVAIADEIFFNDYRY